MVRDQAAGLAGVVLAAGLGTRLRPLTELRPKPLCPLGDSTCLHAALGYLAPHCGPGPENLAVNAFHLAEQVVAAVGDEAHVSVEPGLMGTAGALALLTDWRAGRDVLLVNGDAYLGLPGQPQTHLLAPLLTGWNGRTVRMLVTETASAPDFTGPDLRGGEPSAAGWRYVGACLTPGHMLDRLRPEPSGLFKQVWSPARAAGLLELVRHEGIAIDTGTPGGYLDANLHATGGRSVVGAGAVIDGEITECVVWPGAVVARGERLHRVIRAGTPAEPITLHA